MLTVTIHVTTNQFLNMLIKFQSIKYFLFFRNRTSLSKLKSVNLLRLPDVDSPLVEKTLSIGAVEAGTQNVASNRCNNWILLNRVPKVERTDSMFCQDEDDGTLLYLKINTNFA